jgi:hypothetical protein
MKRITTLAMALALLVVCPLFGAERKTPSGDEAFVCQPDDRVLAELEAEADALATIAATRPPRQITTDSGCRFSCALERVLREMYYFYPPMSLESEIKEAVCVAKCEME